MNSTRAFCPQVSLSAVLFVAVNALFVAKYGARLFPEWWWALTLVFVVAEMLLIEKVLPWLTNSQVGMNLLLVGGLTGIVLLGVLQYVTDPLSIRVDRWSALHYPIQYLLEGKYPYMAQTHLGGYGSPFPVWQLFHIPFYFLGNVGLSFFFCLVVFLGCVYRERGRRAMVHILSLLIISPAVWYEAVVRSDYLSNLMLCATFILWLMPRANQEWMNHHWLSVSVCVALFASTRLTVLLPWGLLLFPFFLQMDWKKKMMSVFVLLLVFVMTFLPVALWDWDAFFHFEYNPWNLQTKQGHSIDFLIYIPLFFWLALQWRGSSQRYFRNVIVMLTIFVAISMLHRMADNGNWNLFTSSYDITYYSAVLPFAGLYLAALQNPR